MTFAFYRDVCTRELETSVLSVDRAKWKPAGSAKKAPPVEGFEVVLEDTVLFPEGGGQNTDKGTISSGDASFPVLHVFRRTAGEEGRLTAVHFIAAAASSSAESACPLAAGDAVRVSLDWGRRLDNMQQHSGQHLISALFENRFSISTTSWWMAENEPGGAGVGVSYIELDRDRVSTEEMLAVEAACNDAIREATRVEVRTFEAGDPELDRASTRGLPEGHKGSVRVVQIGDIDNNMCCGTHVTNLAQLQLVKLLSVEKGKKGKSQLNFLVGDRVRRYLESCHRRERQLNDILRGGPDDHADLASKCMKSLKLAQKGMQSALRELAVREAREAQLGSSNKKFAFIHKRDADADYINTFLHEISDPGLLICLVVGDDKSGPCQMAMAGPEEAIKELGPKVTQMLQGKGGGKGTRLNAKVSNLKDISKAEKLIADYFG